ncbi:MAG TPA: DUF1499 domain-containing protein [Acetobacteraceae bacterium]|nr:DUF1499 domain-containing protein [Acetobacteraceae bacterium]
MTPLAWFVGFFLPACAASGAAGLPTPQLMDMAHIARPTSPNTALAAPAGTRPAPDLVTPRFPLAAPQLYALVVAVAEEQPRTFIAAEYAAEQQAHFVARSAVLNFPDLITAQVAPAGPGGSTLLLYSRSVYGYSDMGVNRQRLSTWLAALESKINRSNER